MSGAARIKAALHDAETIEPLRILNVAEFVALDLPPREMILAPIIPTQGLVMVYALPGIGKTHFGLGAAYAIASGGRFLRYSAPKARRVLYVDGEMPGAAMKERLMGIVRGASGDITAPDNLRILSWDQQDPLTPLPDIGTPEGQAIINRHLTDVDVLVLDNLSSLVSGAENEADAWQPMQTWLLWLRRRGLSIVLVHHAGKSGSQRGTSKRLDTLDTVVRLSRPEDYQSDEGARFVVSYDKARGIFGDDAAAFEAKLEEQHGASVWTVRSIEDATLARVAELTEEGETVRDIAAALGISKSRAGRLQGKAREAGMISDANDR